MAEARAIGIDVGTSSTKGIAVDERGIVLKEAERPYDRSMPERGWSEQDPDDWWQATSEVLEQLRAEDADGIGLTGQMHGLVVLGTDDRPLRPAILWNDTRSQPQAERIEEQPAAQGLRAISPHRRIGI